MNHSISSVLCRGLLAALFLTAGLNAADTTPGDSKATVERAALDKAADAKTTNLSKVEFFSNHMKELNLNDDQFKQLELIVRQSEELARKIYADIEAIKGDELDKMEAVLSAQQMTKLQEFRSKH